MNTTDSTRPSAEQRLLSALTTATLLGVPAYRLHTWLHEHLTVEECQGLVDAVGVSHNVAECTANGKYVCYVVQGLLDRYLKTMENRSG